MKQRDSWRRTSPLRGPSGRVEFAVIPSAVGTLKGFEMTGAAHLLCAAEDGMLPRAAHDPHLLPTRRCCS